MSIRSYIYLVIAVLLLCVLSFFTGKWTSNCPQPVSAKDSVVITQPSIKTTAESSLHKIRFVKKPDTTSIPGFATATFDTTIIEKGDTLAVSKANIIVDKSNFNISGFQDIEIKKYETVIHDTVKTFHAELIPVRGERKFYDSFEGGAVAVILVELITLLVASFY